MTRYSIIIPYRNRAEHLEKLLPRLMQKFEGKDYEVIVAEQDDDDPFCKTVLMNTAVKHSTGDVLIFHDVDYFPMDDVSYEYDNNVGIYPVRKVVFLDENSQEMPEERVPAGYRSFKYDVGNHSGGVVMLSKENFYRMNGFNPSYRGWGKEDDDFLIRFDYHGIPRYRNEAGTFLALYHKDSAPALNDANFIHNNKVMNDFLNTYWMGPSNTACDVSVFDGLPCAGKWLKMRNCRVDTKLISLSLPTRNRVTSLARTLQSFEDTIVDKSQVEIILKIDDDDTPTIQYINDSKFSYDIVTLIGPRDPGGYNKIGMWHDDMARISRGKMLMWYGDDCVVSPNGWDELAAPFQDGFGIVNTQENEGAPFNVVFFYTIKLYRTMQWLGTHPYNDRWFHNMCQHFPQLALGSTQMHTNIIKDNPPSINPDLPPLHPMLDDNEQLQWDGILHRVFNHLRLTGKQ